MKVLVICSGGLDSVSMALRYAEEETTLMTFLYGQKATHETEIVKKLADKYHLGFEQMDISSLKAIFGKENQLTNDVQVQEQYQKSVVVPLRNAVFLQIAMTYAYANGFDKVVLGSHMDDCVPVNGEYAFPDCSPAFFKAFELAMDMGTFRFEKHVKIETASLLGLHKSDLIRFAVQKDPDILYQTWSCYENGEHQCGKCDSCRNRKKAFEEALIIDKTEYGE
ncbi:MAG: 7-cyano-7-deazaguanine synthase [Prevotella sp.]|nr:7-cyano-7-deazaguanine synthase [Prevotella sp.]